MEKSLAKIARKCLFLIVLVLILSITMALVPRAFCQEAYVKVINAATGDSDFIFDAETTPVGHEFIANVTIVDVGLGDLGVYDDLATWQLNLTFNKDILNIKDIFAPADHVFAGKPTTVFPKDINNALGYVVWGMSIGPPSPPDPPSIPFNGTGTLCQIKFNITQIPSPGEVLSCNLTIDTISPLMTSFILDVDVDDIPFTTEHGLYIIPEFPTIAFLAIFLITTLVAIVFVKKTLLMKRHKSLVVN
jgi:hypothetical protein